MSDVVGEPVLVFPDASKHPETDSELHISRLSSFDKMRSARQARATLTDETADTESEDQFNCRWKTLFCVGITALIVELINSSIVVYDIAIQKNEVLSFSLFRKMKVLPMINLLFCFTGIVCACSRKKVPTGNICARCPGCHCVPWSLTILGILRLPEMLIIVIQYLRTRSEGDDDDAAFEWTLIAIGFLYAIVLRAFGFFWLRRSRKQEGYWCCSRAEPEETATVAQTVSRKSPISSGLSSAKTWTLRSLPLEEFCESVL
jgi:hypothetical protein